MQTAAQRLLRHHGAMQLAELAERLQAEGFDLGDERLSRLDEELIQRDELDDLPDGRHLDVLTTIDGAVATSRLTHAEIHSGVVRVEPELGLLTIPFADEFALPDGRRVNMTVSAEGTAEDEWILTGPTGWLSTFEPGGLVAFRISDAVLHVDPVTETDNDPAVAAALADSFQRQSSEGEPIETRQLLVSTLIDHPDAFVVPRPPLTELLAAAGLETYGDWVGEAGTDWAVEGDGDPTPYALDEEERDALALLLGGFELCIEHGPAELAERPELATSLAACLSIATVTEPFISEVFGMGSDPELAAVVAGWAQQLADLAPKTAGPHHLLAACAERLGDAEDGERHLQAGLRRDPVFTPALFDLAWCAEDRGEAVRALSLLRRAGVGSDDPQVERLEHYAAPGPATAARNEPCPCGSGRKYKVCCAKRNGHPLRARVPWLFGKLAEFAQRPAQRDVITEIAIARTGGDPDDPAWIHAALGDPLVADLALFEDGVLERFCDIRGPLLPADELVLARSWIGRPLGLYEVERAVPGASLGLRDLTTGEQVSVTDRSASEGAEVGDLRCARVLAIGDEHMLAPGVLRIPFTLRDRLLALLDTDPGGVEVAAWLAAAEGPPEVTNTDGDPLVACTASVQVKDPAEAADLLDEQFERESDGWNCLETRESGRLLVGTATLDGDMLVVHTNSEARLGRLLDRITGSLAGWTLLDHERIPAGPGTLDALGAPIGAGPSADVAGMAQALDQYMREAEQRWIDESIPALGGATPREAADDPTRRGDLERLLAQFSEQSKDLPEGTGSFNLDRLRGLLGMPEP
jgi:hypothetical protein